MGDWSYLYDERIAASVWATIVFADITESSQCPTRYNALSEQFMLARVAAVDSISET